MFGVETTGTALDNIAHIIQVALTPVFLLSGIATLLNVFSTGYRGSPIGSKPFPRSLKVPTRTIGKSCRPS